MNSAAAPNGPPAAEGPLAVRRPGHAGQPARTLAPAEAPSTAVLAVPAAVVAAAPEKTQEQDRDRRAQAAVAAHIAAALAPGRRVDGAPSDALTATGRRLVLARGAKRARARLCFALARLHGLDGQADDDIARIAAAVELIHGASLIHDDVVDSSPQRRGLPTANAQRGNAFAVLVGDLVLVRALALLAPLGPAFIASAMATIETMTQAALLEVEGRGDASFTLAQWRQMARGKTGALFGLCASLVGLRAQAMAGCGQGAADGAVDGADHAPLTKAADPGRTARLVDAFTILGELFQLADDVIDLRGSDPGKPRGQDIREANPSFPLLVAAAAEPALAAALAQAAHDEASPPPASVTALCERVLELSLPTAIDVAASTMQHVRAVLGADAAALDEVLTWAESLVPTMALPGSSPAAATLTAAREPRPIAQGSHR